jgi:hypothetical protein
MSEPGRRPPEDRPRISGITDRAPRAGHCITCGDDGTPMRVLRLREDALALCEDDAGARHTVELAVVEARVGDRVLVHAGVALVTL